MVAPAAGLPVCTASKLSSGRRLASSEVSRNRGGTLPSGKTLQPFSNRSPEQGLISFASTQGSGYSTLCPVNFFLLNKTSIITLKEYPPTAGPALDDSPWRPLACIAGSAINNRYPLFDCPAMTTNRAGRFLMTACSEPWVPSTVQIPSTFGWAASIFETSCSEVAS